MKINLGSIEMPINAATKSFAVLAKRGAGKSYLGGVMAEEFHEAGIPFVVFDPIDIWWGLRLAADGKGAGLPVVVFGVRNADIQLDRSMGREIARAIVRENISCVISTFGMSKTDMRYLIAEFAEELLHINNTPRHVFIEEAHEYVPQRVQPGMGKTFAAVEALVTMGRNQGIGVTMLNQRAATINKDVLTQLDTLLALRSVGPQDRKALAEWVEEQEAEGDFDKFISSLATLPTGEGWIWSPEFLGVFEKFKIRKRKTFHPDREKIGSKFVMPQLNQIDVQSFIGKFKQAIESRPMKIAKGGKLDKKKMESAFPGAVITVPPPQIVITEREVQNVRNQYESQLIEKDAEIRRLAAIIQNVQRAVGNAESFTTTPTTSSGISLWKNKFGNSVAGRLLNLFADDPNRELNREQACLAIGVSPTAGHTNNEFSKLLRTKAVIKNGSLYRLNPNM